MKLKHNMQLVHKQAQSEEYLELHKNSEPYVQQLMEQSYYKLSHLEPPLPGSGVFGDEEVEPQQPAASSSHQPNKQPASSQQPSSSQRAASNLHQKPAANSRQQPNSRPASSSQASSQQQAKASNLHQKPAASSSQLPRASSQQQQQHAKGSARRGAGPRAQGALRGDEERLRPHLPGSI